MDEVFAKYCAKSPVTLDCIKNLTVAIEPCLDEGERENLKLVLNVSESVANFICYKDGDRIASELKLKINLSFIKNVHFKSFSIYMFNYYT